jgi:signal transduction histidine kinase
MPPDIIIEGDPGLLRIAVENLLRNSWKFTSKREQATIEVGAQANGAGLAYYVRDNGAGFDMRQANRLFRPFQRLHSADDFPGTGIGLATVERVIRRHGGTIWAESVPDEGATFYFDLKTAPNRESAISVN